jgi:hypothetical protein
MCIQKYIYRRNLTATKAGRRRGSNYFLVTQRDGTASSERAAQSYSSCTSHHWLLFLAVSCLASISRALKLAFSRKSMDTSSLQEETCEWNLGSDIKVPCFYSVCLSVPARILFVTV